VFLKFRCQFRPFVRKLPEEFSDPWIADFLSGFQQSIVRVDVYSNEILKFADSFGF